MTCECTTGQSDFCDLHDHWLADCDCFPEGDEEP